MVHTQTIDCVKKAEPLIEDGSSDSMRYATLQIRMGIEYLFYELIPLYRDELPDDITTTKWKPQQIIEAIVECDPHADQDGRVAIGPSGSVGQPGTDTIVYDVKAPSKRLLNKYYHRLGKYLHAPVNLAEHDGDKWRSDLEKAITCLKEFRSGQILINVRPLVEIPCDCGRMIKRNRHGVEVSGEMRCTNPDCRAIYDVKFEDDEARYTLRQTSYHCPYCKTQNFVPVHGLADGVPITCAYCERRVAVRSGFLLGPLDGEPESENAE